MGPYRFLRVLSDFAKGWRLENVTKGQRNQHEMHWGRGGGASAWWLSLGSPKVSGQAWAHWSGARQFAPRAEGAGRKALACRERAGVGGQAKSRAPAGVGVTSGSSCSPLGSSVEPKTQTGSSIESRGFPPILLSLVISNVTTFHSIVQIKAWMILDPFFPLKHHIQSFARFCDPP